MSGLILTYLSIIVTVVATGISVFQIFFDKKKSREEAIEIEKYAKTKETLPIIAIANRRDSEAVIKEILLGLISTTAESVNYIPQTNNSTKIDIAVEVISNSYFLPSGLLFFQILGAKEIEEKAEEIYSQVTNTDIKKSSLIVLIIVTPFLWPAKNKWVQNKIKENKWLEIRVYDADILHKWIEDSPIVSKWIEIKYLDKYQTGGIQFVDDFWEEWSVGPKIKLPLEIVFGGRQNERESLLKQINASSQAIVAIQGASRDEAVAFIVACLLSNNDKTINLKSFLVDSPEIFRQLSIIKTSLILVPRFDDNGVLNHAIGNGHSVFVPLGADSTEYWSNKITLPNIEREAFINALVNSGIVKETAEKYSTESARNITILRRQLEFTRDLPEWAKIENVRQVIPALIACRWNENYENDRNILAKLAGESYEEYSKKLNRWLHISDSPLLKIGSTWRLTSPLDAWINASKNLTQSDFKQLHAAFIEILSEVNPAFELEPEKREIASMYGKNRQFSSWLREGITQSLILVSIYADRLKFSISDTGEMWVDRVIAELLNSDDSLLWKSIDQQLPLIAEASPNTFLNAVDKHLNLKNSPVIKLFEEDPGFITSRTYHNGLLWGLEGLAWMKEYLSRSSLILARLAAVSPKISTANSPINSLVEIFKPWHYQTNANFEERTDVLRLISQKEKEVAWELLINMLPSNPRSVAFPTHKMRWRMFSEILENPKLYKEIWDTHSVAVELLLSIFDFTEIKLSKLITISVYLAPLDRGTVLNFIEKFCDKVVQKDFIAWNSVKWILSHHDYKSVTENDYDHYSRLYRRLMPADDVEREIWVFNEKNPQFVDASLFKMSSDERQEFIYKKRLEALSNIYVKYGIHRIVELSTIVKEPRALGYILGDILENEDEVMLLLHLLSDKKNDLVFVNGFIYRKAVLKGLAWVFDMYFKLKEKKFTNYSLAQFFIPINQSRELWYFINETNEEIKREYWSKVYPAFWSMPRDERVEGLSYLVEYKRFYSAIEVCAFSIEEVSTNIIINILEKAATEAASEVFNLNNYEIVRLFKALDERDDLDKQDLIKLEWQYLRFLNSDYRSPKLLHEEMSSNPEFLIDVLRCVYRSNESDIELKNQERLSEEQIDEQARDKASRAFELLYSWKKVPGVDENKNIDGGFLLGWVEKVRELALKIGLIEVADMYIGQILAQYPENEINWPPDIICSIIENINTDSVKSSFSASIYNKHGSYSRGAFEGGVRERDLAKYFRNLSLRQKNTYPIVATIMEGLSKGYEAEAKRVDEEAERDKLDY